MSLNRQITRRTVLKGLGTTMALPLLEAMLPAAALAGQQTAAPLRTAFLFVPNGIHMQHWTPEAEGTGFDLPPILETMAAHRDQLLVLSGLTHDKARANGDGGGDHARSASCFLTASQPYKTNGAKLRAGISVDQVAAAHLRNQTRFASLEIGCDRGAQSGNCDSGYSCAYSSNIAWRSASTPAAKEVDPRRVFERLFSNELLGDSAEARERRARHHQSVLDFVSEDARRLEARLGRKDRQKLDEYLSAVRDLELRIERAEADGADDQDEAFDVPPGINKDYQAHLRLMCDLLVLAFKTDSTRIATYMLANEGSNRSYRFIDVPEGHHDLSHHGGDEEKQAKISKINQFHATQVAYLLDRLQEAREGEGTLLDNCIILYGAGIGDGNRHNHDNLPILLAGGGCGTITPGRHVRYPKETPLANLYLSLLDRIGAPIERLGDSTGRLDGLTV